MKAQPYKLLDGKYSPSTPEEATHVMLHLPGSVPNRLLPLIGTPAWRWNLSVDAPTFTPSIMTRIPPFVCHSIITVGRVEFLPDCTHDLAGKTMELLEVE